MRRTDGQSARGRSMQCHRSRAASRGFATLLRESRVRRRILVNNATAGVMLTPTVYVGACVGRCVGR
jgi:hypothetical protein